MIETEAKARKLLDAALANNVDPLWLSRTIGIHLSVTETEARSIAREYPFSSKDIMRAFPSIFA